MVQDTTPDMPAESLENVPLISVVIPCLNEAESVAQCVEKALRGIEVCGLSGEVVVVDNGSTDGSAKLARDAGARVVDVPGAATVTPVCVASKKRAGSIS